jgi:hypothetical protein
MTHWEQEPEFTTLLRQCLFYGGVSQREFDRLVMITRTAPPELHDTIERLLTLATDVHCARLGPANDQ